LSTVIDDLHRLQRVVADVLCREEHAKGTQEGLEQIIGHAQILEIQVRQNLTALLSMVPKGVEE
jgi:hypothetical protein